jgi:hypothetical protein
VPWCTCIWINLRGCCSGWPWWQCSIAARSRGEPTSRNCWSAWTRGGLPSGRSLDLVQLRPDVSAATSSASGEAELEPRVVRPVTVRSTRRTGRRAWARRPRWTRKVWTAFTQLQLMCEMFALLCGSLPGTCERAPRGVAGGRHASQPAATLGADHVQDALGRQPCSGDVRVATEGCVCGARTSCCGVVDFASWSRLVAKCVVRSAGRRAVGGSAVRCGASGAATGLVVADVEPVS